MNSTRIEEVNARIAGIRTKEAELMKELETSQASDARFMEIVQKELPLLRHEADMCKTALYSL